VPFSKVGTLVAAKWETLTPEGGQKCPKTINVNIKNVILFFKLLLTHTKWISLLSIYVFHLDVVHRKLTLRRCKQ